MLNQRPYYRLVATRAVGVESYEDPYAFGPALGPLDDYLLIEGKHRELYKRLGAQLAYHEGVDGVRVRGMGAQRAPRLRGRRLQPMGRPALPDAQALRQRHVGDFRSASRPKARSTNMRSSRATACCSRLKADPFGFAAEMRPSTASVVADTADFVWTDAEYLRSAGEGEMRRKPMAIYEAHLGSWRRGEDGRFLTYDELAERARSPMSPTSASRISS